MENFQYVQNAGVRLLVRQIGTVASGLYNHENRKLIDTVANDPANYDGKDKYGNEWYSRNEPDGSQVWVITRNGRIQNAGKDSTPRNLDSETGYSRNPKKNKN